MGVITSCGGGPVGPSPKGLRKINIVKNKKTLDRESSSSTPKTETQIKIDTVVVEKYIVKDTVIVEKYIGGEDGETNFYEGDYIGNRIKLEKKCDYTNTVTRDTAVKFAGISNCNGYSIQQICSVFDECMKRWIYVNDPSGKEYVSSASKTISNGFRGDCDDFAVLMASCIKAIGGDICVVLAEDDKRGSGHAYCEVDISRLNVSAVQAYLKKHYPKKYSRGEYYSEKSYFTIRKDVYGHIWINLDWFDEYDYTRADFYSCIGKDWVYEGTINR